MFKFNQNQKKQIKIDFDNKTKKSTFFAVFSFFNKYYLKSFFGPFFLFVFPVLLLAILGKIMPMRLIWPGIVAMSPMTAGLLGLPPSILELKRSVILKRIGASPVKTSIFTFVIIVYFFVIVLLSIIWLLFWGVIIDHSKENLKILNVFLTPQKFFGFFYGCINGIIMGLSLGFLVITISKTSQQAQVFSMLFYFPSAFLAGNYLDISMIANIPVMNWISRFIPFRFTSLQVISALNNHNIFDLKDISGYSQKQEYILFYNKWEVLSAFFYPLLLSSFFGFFSIRHFTWGGYR